MKMGNLKDFFCLGLMMALVVACSGSHVRGDEVAYHQARNLFDQSREQYHQGNYKKAIAGYDSCITFCQKKGFEQDDSIMELLPIAMVQLMNAYQAEGTPVECIQAFKRLGKQSTSHPMLHLYARDIQVLLAYSLSRTDQEEEAVAVMDKALKMPLHNPTPEKKFRDYAYAAAVYFCVPKQQNKVLKYGQMALAQAKLTDKQMGVQWIVSLMGSLYQRTGDVIKAVNMYEEGIDISKQFHDTLSIADINRGLAEFLISWNMPDVAEPYATTSVHLMDRVSVTNPAVATTAYVTMARVKYDLKQYSVALHYLSKAKTICRDLPYNSGPSDVDVLMGTILVNHPRRFVEGLGMLKRAARDATYGIRSTAYLQMAKFYIRKGYQAAGEAALDSMYAILNAPQHPLLRGEAFGYALSHYLHTNNTEKIVQYSRAINLLKETELNNEVLRKMLRSLVKIETAKKNEQLRLNALKMRQRTYLYIGSALLLVLLLVGVVVVFIRKRISYKKKHLLMTEQLDSTQKDLEQTQKDNRKIKRQLRTLEQEDEIKVKDGVQLSDVLNKKGDEQFRKLFERSYPYFVANLQKKVQSALTAKEVLLCMLIGLGKDNVEIADILHITRKSLNMSKYRLRKKFELSDGSSLENCLMQELASSTIISSGTSSSTK